MRFTPKIRWVFAGLLLCVVTGCKHPGVNFRPFDVTVNLDDSLKDEHGTTRTVEVDLIGINDSDLPRWSKKSVNEYWQPNDLFRTSKDKKTMQFYSDFSPQTLSSGDPLWNEWLGGESKAHHLFVVCFIAGVAHADMDGDQDPWKLILPLDECAWDSSMTEVKLEVSLHGITCLTPQLPLDK